MEGRPRPDPTPLLVAAGLDPAQVSAILTPYGITKLTIERYALMFQRLHNLI